MSDLIWDMPSQTKRGFEAIRGAWVIVRLLADERLPFVNIIHPAAVVGNLAGESGLDPDINEISPLVAGSRGGKGWEQATGSRRIAFEKFVEEHGWGFSDQANYEFLVWELVDDPKVSGDGSENRALQRLMQTTSLEAATYTFEVAFERPSSTSDVNTRIRFAQQAIDAIPNLSKPSGPISVPIENVPSVPPIPPRPTVSVGTANVLDDTIRLLQDVLTIAGYYSGEIDGRPNDDIVDALDKYLDWLDSGGRL